MCSCRVIQFGKVSYTHSDVASVCMCIGIVQAVLSRVPPLNNATHFGVPRRTLFPGEQVSFRNTHTHTNTHTQIHTQIHTHTNTHTHTKTHTQIHTHKYTHKYTHTHTNTHTHKYTHTQIHTHTKTHTHTLVLVLVLAPLP